MPPQKGLNAKVGDWLIRAYGEASSAWLSGCARCHIAGVGKFDLHEHYARCCLPRLPAWVYDYGNSR
jgi:hypothetical protein